MKLFCIWGVIALAVVAACHFYQWYSGAHADGWIWFWAIFGPASAAVNLFIDRVAK